LYCILIYIFFYNIEKYGFKLIGTLIE
jgi:hypothetical protein